MLVPLRTDLCPPFGWSSPSLLFIPFQRVELHSTPKEASKEFVKISPSFLPSPPLQRLFVLRENPEELLTLPTFSPPRLPSSSLAGRRSGMVFPVLQGTSSCHLMVNLLSFIAKYLFSLSTYTTFLRCCEPCI